MLDPLVLPLPTDPSSYLAVHHVTRESAPQDLQDILFKEFSEEVDRGNTYPQQGPLSLSDFNSYFFAHDVFVAISSTSPTPSLDTAQDGRSWDDCLQGFYYIKPNYPGRSSHICNAGFVVRNIARGKRVGFLLGKSYLHFAPRLGYKASVFNLVYSSNLASLAIWDRLGFTRIGVIPKAGRLLQPDGSEAYVDANIIYKSFDDTTADTSQ